MSSIEAAHGAPRNPLITGVEVDAAGYLWKMPPLNMRQLREHQERLKGLDQGDQEAFFAVGVTAITAALSRNYPSLTEELVLDIVDLGNFQTMLAAMNGVSGVVASGEAPARSTLIA